MDIDEFDRVLQAARTKRPFFLAASGERACSAEEVSRLQADIGLALPEEYRLYLQRYGGGYLGGANVFSATPDSEWYLPARNRILPPDCNFIAISDDQCGGFYGFVIDGGACSETVHYWYPMEADLPAKKSASFFAFLISVALA